MGLAASQSRLLMLTMRKNDVESGLMSIANDKLSLSRQSAQLSQNYSNALNATRLAWNLGDSTTDLSYALLMTPNATETSNQYLLTNNYGAVILNDSYAQKLGLGGSGSGDNFTSQYPSATDFVTKFGVSFTTAQKALNAVNCGNTNTNALKLTSVGTQISNLGADIGALYNVRHDWAYANDVAFSIGDGTMYNYERDWVKGHRNSTIIHNSDGGWTENDQIGEAKNWLRGQVNIDTVASYVDSITSTLGTTLQTSVQSDLASQISSTSVMSNYMSGIKAAIEYAQAATKMAIAYNAVDDSAKDKKAPTSGNTNGFKSTEAYNNFNRSDICDDVGDNGNGADNYWVGTFDEEYGIDNSKIMNTFFYYFNMYVADNINNTVDASGTSTRDPNFNKSGAAPQNYTDWNTSAGAKTVPQTLVNTATPTTGDDLNSDNISDYYEAVYYVNLYNAITQKGWAVDSNVDNKSYLEKQVLYGNVNVEKLESSAPSIWNTVSTSDYDSPLTSEADSSMVTKAEAEYTAAKNKLDYKESQLDIQSNTLDTERSAVTTEIDSVNAIIKKNLDVFKVFESNG